MVGEGFRLTPSSGILLSSQETIRADGKGQAMGACGFVNTWDGVDYRDGYRELVSQAEYEYGTDAYNGTISTTRLHAGRPVRIADRYSTSVDKKAEKWMSEHPGQKWVAKVLDLGVVEYDIVSYKKVPQNAEARWQTFYVVKADGRKMKSFKSVADARRYLEEVIARSDGSVDWYCIEKIPENVGGTALSTSYERTCRTVKTKPKRIPKGATLRERHRFVYYGLASC